uniref:Zinc finger Ran-binding domain-containing protein 2 n=1 Tax=Mandrillus leucophaeus TaxID=9568 RepID=A0A2K5XWY2_MANLE
MSTKNFRVSDRDWICPDKTCENVNFPRRTICNRCDREKTTEAKMMKAGGTEIGKTLVEKSRGLFSANDWQCKTCSNVTWARRSECNMCNTPKYAKLEERTGYGGGFNERENVEYIEREESDEKKYRGKAVGPASILKEVEDKESEGEEEDEDEDLSKYKLDEDEDEDDADLSKYNLDASEEEDSNKKKSNRRSHSRSRSSHSRSSSRSSSPSSSGSRSRSRSRSSSKRSRSCGSKSRSSSRSHRVHHLLLRGTEREVVLDLLHLVIAKKDEQDHGHPKPRANPYGIPLFYPDTTGHLLDHPILVPVQVQKRNNNLMY